MPRGAASTSLQPPTTASSSSCAASSNSRCAALSSPPSPSVPLSPTHDTLIVSPPAQVDLLLCAQTFLYRAQTARDLAEREELRQHRGVAGTEALLRADGGDGEEEGAGEGRDSRDGQGRGRDEEAELEMRK